MSKTNELLAGFDTFLNFQRLDFLKNKLLGSAQRIQSAKLKQAQVMAAVSVTGGIGNVTGQLSVLGFYWLLGFSANRSHRAITQQQEILLRQFLIH